MGLRRTPPLSREGSREVIEEMLRPPEDTPERREILDFARRMRERRKLLEMEEKAGSK